MSSETTKMRAPVHAHCYASLVDRLRGIYTIPVNDGAGPLNGKDTFTRKYDGLPPVNDEAAKAIEALIEAGSHLHELLHQCNSVFVPSNDAACGKIAKALATTAEMFDA